MESTAGGDGNKGRIEPEEVNKAPDEAISSLVAAAIAEMSGEQQQETAPLAPYLTLGLLQRVHDQVVALKRSGARATLSKHKVLGAAALRATGGALPPDLCDVDKIGNNIDRWLTRNFADVDKKLCRIQQVERREKSRAALRCQTVTVTVWGSVRRVESVGELRSAARVAPHVPFCAPMVPPPMDVLALQRELNVVTCEAQSAAYNWERERERASQRKKELEDSCEKLAVARREAGEERKVRHQLACESEAVQAQWAAAVKEAERLKAAAGKEKEARVHAEKQLEGAAANLLRLGSQAARAHQEAGVLVQRAEEHRRKRDSEVAALLADGSSMKAELRQKERELKRQQEAVAADLLRLGSQAARAQQEAGVHARRAETEKRKRYEADARAAAEVDELRAKVSNAEKELKRLQREKMKQVTTAAAKEAILGGQTARAHQEAGEHARRAEEAQSLCNGLRAELGTLEGECRQLREGMSQLEKENTSVRSHNETVKQTSKKRLEVKKALVDQIKDLVADNEALREEVERLREGQATAEAANRKLALVPTWSHVRCAGGKGGGGQLQHQHRLAILEQHANGTPPSAIGRNIVAIVKATAPWLTPVEPTVGELRKIGFELTVVEEAMAARKVAAAFRVRLLGFDETTDLQEPSITSNVQIEPTEGAPLEDCILKAAYLSTKGGQSAAVVEEVEGKCFARLRELLRRWQQVFERMFPDAQWTGPDPKRCSLYRLAGGGALMSDTCNAARKAKQLMSGLIQKQAAEHFRQQIGEEEWNALTEERKQEKLRVHLLDCHQHMRNIILKHMSYRQAQHVKAELQEALQQFASWERVTVDYDQLLRAIYKEFHQGGNYYKGKGADFSSWMLEHHPSAFFMHIERAEGGRQDLDYDAAVPIYVNRPFLVQYLHTLVFNSGHKNILEDFLYTACRTEQIIAMSRANAIIDLRISRPMRWLAGKAAELDGWSPIRNNEVMNLAEAVYLKGKDDGSVLLDPNLSVFQKIADEQPLFRELYLRYAFEHDAVLSPDGRTRHLHYQLALKEALDPADESNQRSRDKTVEYLQVQCAAALEKMHDEKLAIADKLTSQDGANAVEKQQTAHTDTQGCHATNDTLAESVFGAYKYERRRLPGISQRRASGLAQSRLMKSLAHSDAIRHRKIRNKVSKRKKERRVCAQAFGYFHSALPYKEQVALLEMARIDRQKQRELDQQDERELQAFRVARRKSNSELELESLIKQFALGLSFFDRYQQRGVKSVTEMGEELRKLTSNQDKLDWLREQIEMRVVGLCWVEFTAHWSCSADQFVGTVEDLTGHLNEILEEEREREIPAHAPAPIMQRKTFKQLGTLTVQATQLANQRLSISAEDLLKAAEKERRRGSVWRRLVSWTSWGTGSRRSPPCWTRRWLEDSSRSIGATGALLSKVFMWCEGTVVAVSDGTIRKSKRSKDSLPAGAVRIRWPADQDFDESETFQWSILNPSDWNQEVHLGWRWPASELAKPKVSGSNSAS